VKPENLLMKTHEDPRRSRSVQQARFIEAIEIIADELDEAPNSVRSPPRARRLRELASDARELSSALPSTWPRVASLALVVFGFVAYLVLK
jgi:hypothetical protein